MAATVAWLLVAASLPPAAFARELLAGAAEPAAPPPAPCVATTRLGYGRHGDGSSEMGGAACGGASQSSHTKQGISIFTLIWCATKPRARRQPRAVQHVLGEAAHADGRALLCRVAAGGLCLVLLVRIVRLRLMCVPTARGCCAHARVGCHGLPQSGCAESRLCAAKPGPPRARADASALAAFLQAAACCALCCERRGRRWAAGARGATVVEGALRRPRGAARRRRRRRPGGVAARRAGAHSLRRASHGRVIPWRHRAHWRQRARGERHAGRCHRRGCSAHGGRRAACRLGGLATRGAAGAGAAAARCAARRNGRCCRLCRACALRASMASSHGSRWRRGCRGGFSNTRRGPDKGGLEANRAARLRRCMHGRSIG